MTAGLLTAEDVSAGYGPIRVVHHVSLSVLPDECLVILGPNGAGKTTLVEALAGHLRTSTGSMHLAGQRCEDWPANRRARHGLGYVAQTRRLWPALTVEENLHAGAYGSWSTRSSLLDMVRQQFPAVNRLRLSQRAGSLSGGEQQILAISRALMGTPQVLILDEPSTGLAPAIMDDVAQLVRSLTHTGVSVILIEQMVGLALEVANRAIVLVGGEIALEDSAEGIRNNTDLLDVYLRG